MNITSHELQALLDMEAEAREQTLDDLLCRWNAWLRTGNPARGYGSSAPGCGGYRTSRQYDDANGAMDEQIEHTLMQQADREISALEGMHRIAIHTHARNLAVGCEVFVSPRLPADPGERARIIRSARAALMKRLTIAGMM